MRTMGWHKKIFNERQESISCFITVSIEKYLNQYYTESNNKKISESIKNMKKGMKGHDAILCQLLTLNLSPNQNGVTQITKYLSSNFKGWQLVTN